MPSARTLTTAIAVVLCLGGAGCTSNADKAGGRRDAHTLVLHVLNTRSADEVKPFTDKVAELSKGALHLTVTDTWRRQSTTSEPEAIRAMQSGQADLAIVPARAWDDFGVTSFDALLAPMEVDSMALQEKVLVGALPDQMLQGLKSLDLVGVGIIPGSMRKPSGITRELLSPSDYRGAIIGISPSPLAARSLRALGAVPAVSAFNGTDVSGFDGIDLAAGGVGANQYDGVVRTITQNVNLWPRPSVVFATAKTIRSLSGQQLNWLQTAARDSVGASTTTLIAGEVEQVGSMCRRGKTKLITATPTQLVQLRAAFAPVDAWLRRDPQTRTFLDEIEAMRATGIKPYPQESLSCVSAVATSGPIGSVTPFDGTYRGVRTERDARKVEPNVPPENWGTATFVFDRGRFETTNENAESCTWAYGTYVVSGHRVEWTFAAGGGLSPTGATMKPGEQFDFGWSRYRDTMKLAVVPGAVSPQAPTLGPFHVISNRPDASYLSSRCPPPAH